MGEEGAWRLVGRPVGIASTAGRLLRVPEVLLGNAELETEAKDDSPGNVIQESLSLDPVCFLELHPPIIHPVDLHAMRR